ncbi:hypothetical protein GCM10009122_33790 [Fulvivirga kasyanovii]|uniref:DUF2267 domain-containing protein n=1 Tax=Fulvivirga kasyanovii TaxID=396812 RepID=A0ABW9RI64_9BACT|nr:DUF2267 domain-containing protein [Fulvivirga kasyanovii]MTI23592.1 DUF2267 domain-containing protein [Fulvivirga kasyanovii]
MEIDYNKLAQNDEGCIEEIKEALGIHCNFKAGRIIGRVLHTLRSSLTYVESADLIQHLPDNIKIIYVSDWKLKTNQIELKSLESFVNEVIVNDSAHAERVLSSRMVALDAIITIIRVLNKHINILSYDFLKYPLNNQLKEAMYKAA